MKTFLVAFVLSTLSAVFALSGLPFQALAAGQTYQFLKSNNHVNWTAIGTPGFLRINGSGGAAEGKIDVTDSKASGSLSVKLADYTTGLDLRDHHMKEKFLETNKFPTATLLINAQAFTPGKESTISGDLTIKGATKPVKVAFTLSGKSLSAKFKLSIKDYPAIGVPSHLGVTVADEVGVTVDASL